MQIPDSVRSHIPVQNIRSVRIFQEENMRIPGIVRVRPAGLEDFLYRLEGMHGAAPSFGLQGLARRSLRLAAFVMKEGSKEGGKAGRQEGRKAGKKEGRQEGRKGGRKVSI